MSGRTTDYALDKIIFDKLPIIFLLIYRGNIAPFIQRTEGALQTLAFKKQLHLKIWTLAVKSDNFLEADRKQTISDNDRGSGRVLICFHNIGIFQNLVLGLQSKKHTHISQCDEQYSKPYFKRKTQGLRRQNLPTVLAIQEE